MHCPYVKPPALLQMSQRSPSYYFFLGRFEFDSALLYVIRTNSHADKILSLLWPNLFSSFLEYAISKHSISQCEKLPCLQEHSRKSHFVCERTNLFLFIHFIISKPLLREEN